MTKVIECKSCKPHAYQDKQYGNKMRVHNSFSEKNEVKYRCTVCLNEKNKT
jgi:hypothetical protein